MSNEMRKQIDKFKNFLLNESCEDGSCIPFPHSPEGKWKDLEQTSKDSYDEYINRGGTMDGKLFDTLYDDMFNKSFFTNEKQQQNIWYDEDERTLNKNEMDILKTFPLVDTINSWSDWVNSPWFETTYLSFSKKSRRDPITVHMGDDKKRTMSLGEEPIKNKKMRFEFYLERLGPLLVKKIPTI